MVFGYLYGKLHPENHFALFHVVNDSRLQVGEPRSFIKEGLETFQETWLFVNVLLGARGNISWAAGGFEYTHTAGAASALL